MPTQAQYEFFKCLYTEEAERYKELGERNKLLLGIITAFIGTLALKADDVKKSAATLNVDLKPLLVAAVLFALALIGCLWAAAIRKYEGVADPEWVFGEYENGDPADTDFYRARIADYGVAAGRNTLVNNRVARILGATTLAAALAVFAILLVFVQAITSNYVIP